MQGSSSLTIFQQTITLSGRSSLNIYDYDVALIGSSSFTAIPEDLGYCSLSSSSFLFASASYYYGYSDLPHLNSLGRAPGVDVSLGIANLQALTTYGEGGGYVPEATTMGYGNLSILFGFGLITQSNYGEGDADLGSLQSLGGDYRYGIGDVDLQSLISYASYSNIAIGFYSFKNIDIYSEASVTPSGNGDIRFRSLSVIGYTGLSGSIVLPEITVDSVTQSNLVASGQYELIGMIIQGNIIPGPVGLGNIIFNTLLIDATAISMCKADGSIFWPMLNVGGGANFSPLGDKAGNYILPSMAIQGYVNNPLSATILSYSRETSCIQ